MSEYKGMDLMMWELMVREEIKIEESIDPKVDEFTRASVRIVTATVNNHVRSSIELITEGEIGTEHFRTE